MTFEEIFKPLIEANTPTEMRRAIEAHQLHSPLVRQVLTVAEHGRISEADTYAMLAYFALQSLASAQRAHAELLQNGPAPIIIQGPPA